MAANAQRYYFYSWLRGNPSLRSAVIRSTSAQYQGTPLSTAQKTELKSVMDQLTTAAAKDARLASDLDTCPLYRQLKDQYDQEITPNAGDCKKADEIYKKALKDNQAEVQRITGLIKDAQKTVGPNIALLNKELIGDLTDANVQKQVTDTAKTVGAQLQALTIIVSLGKLVDKIDQDIADLKATKCTTGEADREFVLNDLKQIVVDDQEKTRGIFQTMVASIKQLFAGLGGDLTDATIQKQVRDAGNTIGTELTKFDDANMKFADRTLTANIKRANLKP